jgi:glycosyltransferase involved in cell wall biosynthesis
MPTPLAALSPAPVPVPIKVLHIITGLSTGGAEAMLVKVLAALPKSDVDNTVVALGARGPMADKIEALGVPLICLNASRTLGGLLSAPRLLARLICLLRSHPPDAVQCWMYHANLFGGIAARLAGRIPVVWGLRQSDLNPARTKATTRLIARLSARLSRTLPTRILACADAARDVHVSMGYDNARMTVIPNGFDTDVFRPDPEARTRVRRERGIADDAFVVGLPARFDPQKDHATFLTAAAKVLALDPKTVFVLCGKGTTLANTALTGLIADTGIPATALRLLGERRDMPAVMAALDVVVLSSSFGEGFPNVLGEGMAAGAIPVATDSGDSRAIIEGIGFVAPPRDPSALACAIGAALQLAPNERKRRTDAGRERVIRDYSINVIARRYLALWRDAAKDPR